jgi:hypothetical protein
MCKKIDIYVKEGKEFTYKFSTNSVKTCKEAKIVYCEMYNELPENVKCNFSKR